MQQEFFCSSLFVKGSSKKFTFNLDFQTNHPSAKKVKDMRMFTARAKDMLEESGFKISLCTCISFWCHLKGFRLKINTSQALLFNVSLPRCSKVTAHVNSKVQNCQQKQMKLLLRFFSFLFLTAPSLLLYYNLLASATPKSKEGACLFFFFNLL